MRGGEVPGGGVVVEHEALEVGVRDERPSAGVALEHEAATVHYGSDRHETGQKWKF